MSRGKGNSKNRYRVAEIQRNAGWVRCKLCQYEGDTGLMEQHFERKHKMEVFPLSWTRYVTVLSWRSRNN